MRLLERLKLKYENEVDFFQWSKRLLKTYWYICIIITIGASVIFATLIINGEYEIKFKDMSYFEYIMVYIIIHFILIALSILASKAALMFFNRKKNYTMQAFTSMLCMSSISAIVTVSHYTVNGVCMSFSLVCFISLIYMDKKPVIFAVVTSVLIYLTIAIIFLYVKSQTGEIKHGIEEIITTVVFICTAAAISIYILSRKEILISNVMRLTNE